MNIRVIVSSVPGVIIAEDHREIEIIKDMTNDQLAEWVRGIVITSLTRGPMTVKRAASS